MPSAIISFSDNFQDVEDLVEVHGTMGGAGPGRRWNLAALNKAAIVLTCAIWEAFVEDLVDEAVGHIAQQLTVPANLPLQLRKRIAKKIKEDSHELSPWTLAGTGWQSVLRNSAADLVSRTAGSLNTPKSPQLRNLFNDTLGIADITSSWRRHRMTPTQAAKSSTTSSFSEGAIAHRGRAANSVTMAQVRDFMNLVSELTRFTDQAVRAHVRALTSVAMPLVL